MNLSKEVTKGVRALSILDLVNEGEYFTFIVYERKQKPKWFQKWLHKDFHHCYVIHWDGLAWHRIEKVYGCLDVTNIWTLDTFAVGMMNIERYYQAKGFITQRVDISNRNYDKIRVPQVITTNTCVEVVKDFIGCRKWSIFTPYQLYKHLGG